MSEPVGPFLLKSSQRYYCAMRTMYPYREDLRVLKMSLKGMMKKIEKVELKFLDSG